MKPTNSLKTLVAIFAVALFTIGSTATASPWQALASYHLPFWKTLKSHHRAPSHHSELRFDIVENGTQFSFDSEPVHENGLPAYGNEFITEGYLYPYGFLDTHEGVNQDGTPAYPDEVLGRWTCRGWHVGDGAMTRTGPVAVTTQLFDLNETYGAKTIVTEGYEIADFDVPVKRAITGGTGRYNRTKGDSSQTFLGFNNSFGVKLRVVLRPAR